MAYRLLKSEEVSQLISQGCYAENWSEISVNEDLYLKNIRNTRFEGKITLGNLSGDFRGSDGSAKSSGIYNSFLRNCGIGDQSYISDVRMLSGYSVADNVILENIGSLEMKGESAFGNGTEIEVLNEAGGRGLPVFDRLSSQIAYLAVLYRHDKEFTARLLGLIKEYSESKRSSSGRIETGCIIRDTQIIRNVFFGAFSIIEGACLLEEGSVVSCKEAPSFIGEGVIARKFIVLSGSKVDGGALIDRTFIGQAVRMGKQFSAENSAFFANCEAFHGEGCSIFAGPYTVTHHKSTLLIASLYSFFNAGSGTNQSNHMYKLGPVHQGILERGSKTGSFAYLLLPCVIGAYTVVMGKHLANFDTSDFPFSYITEEKGKSELTPAMNIFTVGTRRDSEKWSARDKRQDPEKLDLIHFDLFNPYIVARIVNGINILNDLSENTPKTQDYINYKGINIHRLLLKTSRKFYEMALKVYLGQELVRRLEGISGSTSLSDIRQRLSVKGGDGTGKWVDVCGLFAPASRIEALIDSVRSGSISSISSLAEKLREIFYSYDQYAWEWCSALIGKLKGEDPGNISTGSLIQILGDWKINAVKFNNMILKDAEKEFDTGARLGFGIDGDEKTRELDFEAVRGEYAGNNFVSGLIAGIENIERTADRLISALEKIQ